MITSLLKSHPENQKDTVCENNMELQTLRERITLWIILVFKSHLDLRKLGSEAVSRPCALYL